MILLSEYAPILRPFGVIYGLKSPSDKWYIGQTKNKPDTYIRHHYEVMLGIRRPALHPAIIKYGFNSFEIYILYECKSKEELNKKEYEFILLYDSLADNGNGYNLTWGGDCGDRSILSKCKMKNAAKLRAAENPEIIERLTESKLIWKGDILSPDGILYQDIKNIKQFCILNNIHYGHLLNNLHANKWKLINLENIKTGEHYSFNEDDFYKKGTLFKWTILDPNGNTHKDILHKDINALAQQFNVSARSIRRNGCNFHVLSKINIKTGEELISGIT